MPPTLESLSPRCFLMSSRRNRGLDQQPSACGPRTPCIIAEDYAGLRQRFGELSHRWHPILTDGRLKIAASLGHSSVGRAGIGDFQTHLQRVGKRTPRPIAIGPAKHFVFAVGTQRPAARPRVCPTGVGGFDGELCGRASRCRAETGLRRDDFPGVAGEPGPADSVGDAAPAGTGPMDAPARISAQRLPFAPGLGNRNRKSMPPDCKRPGWPAGWEHITRNGGTGWNC